tara:strand:- start:655 stop:1113 length:459 start_codon:yes stop_codon:yes gene_type:complete
MATSIRNATLTVKIKEEITLNGSRQDSENIFRISDVNEISKRIVTIPASEVTIISFHASAIAAGTFLEGDIRYIRLTNKDDTNYITLNIEGDASTDFSVRLDPKASFLIVSTNTSGVVDYADISGATLEDLTGIKATANSAASDLEIFVASA